jgi:hypothetical protein
LNPSPGEAGFASSRISLLCGHPICYNQLIVLEVLMPYRTMISRVTLIGLVLLGMSALNSASAFAQRTTTIRHVLDAVQPDLKLTDVTLSDALDYVRDTANVNLSVDWKSLEAVNIDRNTLVNLHLHDVTLRKALTMMLNEVGAGNLLTFYVQDNVLQITTTAKADTMPVTMVYPVGDLLIQIPDYKLQDISGIANQGTGGGGATIGGSNTGTGIGASLSSGNSGSSGSVSTGNTANLQTQAQAGQALVDLIKSTIRPEIWTGGNCSIVFFRNALIVTAPISVQEAIGGPIN